MAYTTPPTFADNTILTAANLNILADNIEFLWSLVSGVSIPFAGQTMTSGGESRRWTFRHQGRYLHYKVRLTGGDIDEFELLISVAGLADQDGVIDHSNHTNPYTWSGYVDLDALTTPPDPLDWVEVHFLITFSGGGSELIIDHLIESEATSL